MVTEVVETEQGPRAGFDGQLAVTTFDQLIDAVSVLLPVNRVQYPDLPQQLSGDVMQFCLRHSALHFSKTAGRLAAFVEDADHGSFQEIEKLEGIVAASLINSFKLADEIGLSGSRLVESIRLRFSQHAREVSRT